MAKTYKCLSHAERMQNRNCGRIVDVVALPTEYIESIQTVTLENGVRVVKSESVKKKFADRDRCLKWYDFSLDSLALSGMLGNASFMTLSDSTLSMADHIDGIASTLENNDLNKG